MTSAEATDTLRLVNQLEHLNQLTSAMNSLSAKLSETNTKLKGGSTK